MHRERLSKRSVDAARPGPSETIVWDVDLHGFGLRIYPSGRKVFFVQYRPQGSRKSRRLTIGPYGPIAPEVARTRAREILGQVALGQDPAAERVKRSEEPTVHDLVERFLEEHVAPRLKPQSAYEYNRALRREVAPRLGAMRLKDVTPKDVAKLKKALTDRPIMANRTLRYLSSAFTFASSAEVGWLEPGTNPINAVQLNRERRRVRAFSDDELIRILGGLAQQEAHGANPSVVAALRLSVWLGWRISEALGLRWEDVDLERRIAVLRDAKAGTRTTRLSKAAVDILEQAPRTGPVLAPGRDGSKPIDYKSAHRVWKRACESAGVENAQIHDCRRSIATRLANENLSVPILQAVLGHTTPHMAIRYVADANASAAAAVDIYGAVLSALPLSGEQAQLASKPEAASE